MFHNVFIKNNKDKCIIIINNKEYKLKEYLYIHDNYKVDDLIHIKLKGINNIIDASYMFYDCTSLSELPNISIWNV